MSGGLGPAHRVRRGAASPLFCHMARHSGATWELGVLTSKSRDTSPYPSPPALFLQTLPGPAARCMWHQDDWRRDSGSPSPAGAGVPSRVWLGEARRLLGWVRAGRGTVGGSQPCAGVVAGSPRRPPDG